MISNNDILIAIAFGGETKEVIEVVKFARRLNTTIISITGKMDSRLAQLSHFTIDGSVTKEACPLNLVPTSSSTLALALGDSLAIALMRARNFSERDFAFLHPGGSIGRKLSLVKDHMRSGKHFQSISEDANFSEILEKVANPNFGIVAITSDKGDLLGSITDGDLRRALIKYGKSALDKRAKDIMVKTPKTILSTSLAIDGIKQMEKSKITALFVVDKKNDKTPIGLIRLHDLIEAKII